MPESSNLQPIHKHKSSLTLRGLLLIFQILLPIGLYFALRASHGLVAGLLSGLFLISMLLLVWLG